MVQPLNQKYIHSLAAMMYFSAWRLSLAKGALAAPFAALLSIW